MRALSALNARRVQALIYVGGNEFDEGDGEEQPRALNALQPAQSQHHRRLPFKHYIGIGEQHKPDENADDKRPRISRSDSADGAHSDRRDQQSPLKNGNAPFERALPLPVKRHAFWQRPFPPLPLSSFCA